MIKLLFSSDIVAEAALDQSSAAYMLIEKCGQNEAFQAWSLSSVVQELMDRGIPSASISQVIENIAQIPINAYLNKLALNSSLGYRMGLYQAAAETFKIDLVVCNDVITKSGGITFLGSEDALALDDDRGADKVDFMNLNLGLHPFFNQVDEWYMEIIQNTAFAGGNHVQLFEQEFAEFCGSKEAIGVSNGTDALILALLAMGIGTGDEVITVPNTFIATTEAISRTGANPIFVDVLPDTYCMDPELIEVKITDRTKAIVPVHLYGQIADMVSITAIAEKHGLKVLEDACQAHGAISKNQKAGTFGDIAAFSMYPGKNLGAFGEAGCVVTSDANLAETIRCLKDHGQSTKYYHRLEGFNNRMDNLQAAAVRAKLPLLDAGNEKRRQRASMYLEKLKTISQIKLPEVADFSAHVFHLFVVLVPDPAALSEYLRDKGVFTAFHYPVPLHLQDAYKDRGESEGSYPVTEYCAKHLLSLPMFPELSEGQVDKVCNEIKNFYNQAP
jgi:dTDP-4-amino-4,6-dideoxygalactose transaminase